MIQTEQNLRKMLGRQVKRYLKYHVKGAIDGKGRFEMTKIADRMNEYYHVTEFDKNNINSYLNSPQWSIIKWLIDKCGMNIDWLLHGEENSNIAPTKLPEI